MSEETKTEYQKKLYLELLQTFDRLWVRMY